MLNRSKQARIIPVIFRNLTLPSRGIDVVFIFMIVLLFLKSEGVTPKNCRNALDSAAGVSYPVQNAISWTGRREYRRNLAAVSNRIRVI
jgi:hypothetical protein